MGKEFVGGGERGQRVGKSWSEVGREDREWDRVGQRWGEGPGSGIE